MLLHTFLEIGPLWCHRGNQRFHSMELLGAELIYLFSFCYHFCARSLSPSLLVHRIAIVVHNNPNPWRIHCDTIQHNPRGHSHFISLSADSRRFHSPPSSSSSSPIVRTQFLYSPPRSLSLRLSLLISLSRTHSLTSSQLLDVNKSTLLISKFGAEQNEVGSETRVPASNVFSNRGQSLSTSTASAHSPAPVTIPPPCVRIVSLHHTGPRSLSLPFSFVFLFAGNVWVPEQEESPSVHLQSKSPPVIWCLAGMFLMKGELMERWLIFAFRYRTSSTVRAPCRTRWPITSMCCSRWPWTTWILAWKPLWIIPARWATTHILKISIKVFIWS